MRRVSLTYNILLDVGGDRANICRTITLLRRSRPVLICTWIRFALNSLPTSSRIHDHLLSSCPACANSSDHVRHIMSCWMLFSCAWNVLISRRPFVRRACNINGCGAHLFGLAAECHLHCNTETSPLTYRVHVLRRLDLYAKSVAHFEHCLELQFVVQQIFIAARRHCCDAHCESFDNVFMVDAAHADMSFLDS